MTSSGSAWRPGEQPDVLVVDDIQLIESREDNKREQTISSITRKLQNLSPGRVVVEQLLVEVSIRAPRRSAERRWLGDAPTFSRIGAAHQIARPTTTGPLVPT